MKTALLINGAKDYTESKGKLNAALQAVAKAELENMGFGVLESVVDNGYDGSLEVEKWMKSDLVIWQMPAWWMGEPWIVKKYIDEVFMAGFGKFLTSDGRHADNPDINYGKGGLMQGKKMMISATWNAPLRAFTDKNEFFEGVGVEMVYFHFRKIHEFIGMSVLPSFMCNDVVKNPKFEEFVANYKAHLRRVLG